MTHVINVGGTRPSPGDEERFHEWYAEHVWRSFLKYGQMKGDKQEYIPVSGESTIDIKPIVDLIPD